MSVEEFAGLVSTEWLFDHLNAPDVRIIDATYFMPMEGKSARDEFNERHIPGAQFFDIDEIADTDRLPLPHMVPSAEKFASKVRKLGLGDGSRIVVYDSRNGATAATRVWWMFRLFGHRDVCVLDGGIGKWIREDRPLEEGPAPKPQERHFTVRMNSPLLRTKEQVIANIDHQHDTVVDARSAERFAGQAAEPWPGHKKGHIPQAKNLPWDQMMDQEKGGIFKSPEEIKALFDNAGVDLGKSNVASCGSGVTACVLAFGAFLASGEDMAVYDGSWAEWGAAEDTPVET